MVVAFGGFATGTDMWLKEFGFGLAAAVAIDALLVRCLIVPAILRWPASGTGRCRRGRADRPGAPAHDSAGSYDRGPAMSTFHRYVAAPLLEGRVLRPLGFLASGIPLGPAWFVLLVTGWSSGLGLAITLLGIPVLLGLASPRGARGTWSAASPTGSSHRAGPAPGRSGPGSVSGASGPG